MLMSECIVGMKVVAKSKSRACPFNESQCLAIAESRGQPFLYVVDTFGTTVVCYQDSAVNHGELFSPSDLEPYKE